MNIHRNLLDTSLRRVLRGADAKMRPYDRYGVKREDMEWCPLAGSVDEGYECFLLRFSPGAVSTPHEHTGQEQFLMLEGELRDCDGTVFREGDFVSFQPGSRHYSVSEAGCTMLVILRGRNRPLSPP